MSIMNNRRGDRKPANPFYGGKLHSTLTRNTPQKPYPFETANSQFAHIWSRKGFKPSDLRPGTSTPDVRCPKSVIRSLTSEVPSPMSSFLLISFSLRKESN